MISVSEQAKAILWETLQESGIPQDQGLRLQPGVDGFVLGLDKPNGDDRVIRHRNVPVLFIDGQLDDEVDDLLIDIAEDPEGSHLTLRRLPVSQNGTG